MEVVTPTHDGLLCCSIELLAQRKNRQVNDYLSLEQQAIELREVGELQATRVDEAKMICSSLMRR